MPDRKRSAAAVHTVHRFVVIIANPYGSTEVGSVTNEPGINVGIGRTGFTCCRTADSHAACSAADKNILQHISSQVCCFGINNTFGFRLSFVQNLTLTVNNLQQSNRLAIHTIACQNAVGCSHFQGINALAEAAECHSEVCIAVGAGINQSSNTHFFGIVNNFAYTNLLGQLNGRHVYRTYQSSTQAYITMPCSVGVLRFPAGREFFFLIFNDTGRRITVLHSGQIDKRLEGRTGLTYCKSSTVELILAAAADHSFNITVMRVNGNQSHLWLSQLLAVCIIARQMLHSIFSSLLHIRV